MPIVAMTAHAMKGDEERCLDAGMDGYVSKPISAQKLFDEIDRLVPAARVAPEAAPVPPIVALEHRTGDEPNEEFQVPVIGNQ